MKTHRSSKPQFLYCILLKCPSFSLSLKRRIPHISSQFPLENLASKHSLCLCVVSVPQTVFQVSLSLYFTSISGLVPVTQLYREKNLCHRIPFPKAMKEVLLIPRNQALQCLANGSPSKSVCSAEPWIWTYALCPVLPTAHQNMMYPEKYKLQFIGWFSLEWCPEKMFQPKSFKEKYNDGSLCF